jgi:hypothetical protein
VLFVLLILTVVALTRLDHAEALSEQQTQGRGHYGAQ